MLILFAYKQSEKNICHWVLGPAGVNQHKYWWKLVLWSEICVVKLCSMIYAQKDFAALFLAESWAFFLNPDYKLKKQSAHS